MREYNFSDFPNVELINTDLDQMSNQEKQILYVQAQYCQAMVDGDVEKLRKLTSSDKKFVHMSGKEQTLDEYLNDIKNGKLQYFSIGIDIPEIIINESNASIKFRSILDANAYGVRGTFPMSVKHHYKKQTNEWIAVN